MLELILGYQGAAMLLRSITSRNVAVLVNVDVHVEIAMISRMPYGVMTTEDQDADEQFCVVNSVSIEHPEMCRTLWKILILGFQDAAMLLRSINS